MKITPASGSVGAKPKNVVFQFNEVVAETPKGAQDLSKLVFISPKSGEPEVSWSRSKIEIKPKKGFKLNTVYTVTVAAGIMDLHNNSIDSATRIVFSTGVPIPDTKISGVVFDWQAGNAASKAIVEAIGRDSTTYQTISDSIGRYSLDHVPPGPYTLRAFVDGNQNRLMESTEPWDTIKTTLISVVPADFYAFRHDSIGVRVSSVNMVDSMRVRVTFDRPLGVNQTLSAEQFIFRKADSTTLGVASVFTAPQQQTFDSLQRKAVEDSMIRARRPLDMSPAVVAARDSAAKRALQDSIARATQQAQQARRQPPVRGARPTPPRDTTPPPKMNRPRLYTDVVVRFDRKLEPNTQYVLTVRNVRSLSGIQKAPPPPYAFRTPKPDPKKDSTTAPGRGGPPPRRDTASTTSIPVKR